MFLKDIPLLFDQDVWIKEFVSKNKNILIHNINSKLHSFYFIDLTAIPLAPINYREIFVKWLIIVNKTRLKSGQELLCNYEVIRQCPLWSIIPMPFKRSSLESVGTMINKKPSKPVGSIGSKPSIKSIRSGKSSKNK